MKSKTRQRGVFSTRMLALVCVLAYPTYSQSISSIAPFTAKGCIKTNFPLGLKMSFDSLPPEVRFYCAASWDFALFETVRGHMMSAGLNVPDIFARSAALGTNKILLNTTFLARDQAEAGPPGMGDTWQVYYLLPYIYSLHASMPDTEMIVAKFHASDIAAMRKVADAINWKQSALPSARLHTSP